MLVFVAVLLFNFHDIIATNYIHFNIICSPLSIKAHVLCTIPWRVWHVWAETCLCPSVPPVTGRPAASPHSQSCWTSPAGGVHSPAAPPWYVATWVDGSHQRTSAVPWSQNSLFTKGCKCAPNIIGVWSGICPFYLFWLILHLFCSYIYVCVMSLK